MRELSSHYNDPPEAAEPARPRVQRMRPLAYAARVALAVLFCAGFVAFSYRLALARVPQYRATLESLARARTGLDLHFGELDVRWGWYGPEAVFREVELGEPGAASVLLRASELVVGLDLWRTLQSGRLQAGRMTLVAPDIDIARLASQHASAARPGTAPLPAASWDTALLEKWPEGRIDLEGGTLTLPDVQSPMRTARLLLRRATLRHGAGLWSATAQTLLPERLGSAALFALQLSDERVQRRGIAMRIHFQGRGVRFAGWQGLVQAQWPVPATGSGDIELAMSFSDGQLGEVSGQVRAQDLAWHLPAASSGEELQLGAVQGAWHFWRSAGAWHLRARDISFGASGRGAPRAALRLDGREDAGELSGEMANGPLRLLLVAVPCIAPRLALPDPTALQGTLAHFAFRWNGRRTSGARLELAAQSDDAQVALPGTSLRLAALHASLAGSERELSVDLQSSAARLSSPGARNGLDGVRASAHLHLMRLGDSWQVAADHVALEHAAGKLYLHGTLRARAEGMPPSLSVHASLADGDAATLAGLLEQSLPERLAAQAARVRGGRIPHAELDWIGAVGAPPEAARLFNGSLALEDARMGGAHGWPDLEQLWARLVWRGDEFHAQVQHGQGGPFHIDTLSVAWRRTRPDDARLAGQASTRLEEAVAWLRVHPEFDGFASGVRDLDVRGPATVSFSLDAPAADLSGAPRLRVLTQLEADVVRLASPLPAVSSLTGVLAIDSGHLQSTTLHGSWLGGPLALHVGERREARASALSLQAQGTLDAHELMRALGLEVGTAAISGRTGWSGELICPLLPAQAPQDELPSWRAQVDTSLLGVSSALPAPLAKSASALVPLHLDLRGTTEKTRLQLKLAGKAYGVLDLGRDGGGWQPSGGLLALVESPPRTVPQQRFTLTGHIDRLDLPRWLLAWRALATASQALPLQADLNVGALLVAGESYPNVALRLTPDEQGATLHLESDTLTGSVRWPASAGRALVEAHLSRVNLAQNTESTALLALLAAFGPEADLSADRFVWQGRSLGSLRAHLQATGDRLTIAPIQLSNAHGDLQARVRCEASGPCRMRLELNSRDTAASLADFGFRSDLRAASAAFEGELEWAPGVGTSARAWLAGLSGHLSLALGAGTLEAAARTQPPFALLAVPQLLRDSSVASGITDPQATPLAFSRLSAEYELHDGNAFTSNLQLDGDAEILMSGRIGLIAQDYDLNAQILRGEERLPAPVRRFATVPRVAALWMAVRDLLSVAGPSDSRVVLHLGGTWDAPVVRGGP